MSLDLATLPGDDSPIVPMTSKSLAQITQYPSLLLPPIVRPALLECWLCHKMLRGLEDGYLPIAAPLAIWINKYDLRPDDAAEILYSMQRPGQFKGLAFGNEFLAALDEKCERAIKSRDLEKKRQAEAESRRASPGPDAQECAKIRELIRGFTSQ